MMEVKLEALSSERMQFSRYCMRFMIAGFSTSPRTYRLKGYMPLK